MYVLACEDCDYISEYGYLNCGVTECVRCQSTELEIVEVIEEEE